MRLFYKRAKKHTNERYVFSNNSVQQSFPAVPHNSVVENTLMLSRPTVGNRVDCDWTENSVAQCKVLWADKSYINAGLLPFSTILFSFQHSSNVYEVQ